ncbi:MAG: hypothetical protein N3A54_03280, partial [Patescibacteria group bacterium]|nr:hypothetical protein [Patescibacteria group bacterium]
EYTIEFLVNGKPFSDPYIKSVRTGPTLDKKTNGMAPIYGSVVTEENKPAAGALVFLTFGEDSQLLSTLVKPSGSWMIPLNLLRSKDLTRLIQKTDEVQTISIKVRLDGKESTVLTDTLTMSPVPKITLGNDYDFREQAKQKTDQVSKSFSSVLGESTIDQKDLSIQLINPQNNASIPGDPPLFSGTGIPKNIVTLLVGKENMKVYTTRVQPDGTWRFSPEKPIGIGKNRVTMTTLNEKNIPVTITHEFQIMKSGTQVLGDATPSATLMPTATEMPLPTETPTPTPTQEIPTTGQSNLTNILFITGFMMILGGLLTLAW